MLDILNEPTAAALAYAFKGFGAGEGKSALEIADTLAELPARAAVVYDLGGGTFDVTVIRIHGATSRCWRRRGMCGWVGGNGTIGCLTTWRKHLSVNIRLIRARTCTAQNLLLAAEDAKKILSSRRQTHYVINHAGRTFTGEITREKFEEMTSDLLYRTESRLTRVIKQAKLSGTGSMRYCRWAARRGCRRCSTCCGGRRGGRPTRRYLRMKRWRTARRSMRRYAWYPG